jgi:phenylalanine-4-hydroxylase
LRTRNADARTCHLQPLSSSSSSSSSSSTTTQKKRYFAKIAIEYKHDQPIPHVEYTPEETETWKTIYTQLTKLYPTHACAQFNKNFPLFEQNCG